MATLNGAYNSIGRQKEKGHIAKKLHTPQRFVNILINELFLDN
ncbi:hypothetical protein HMPREF9419_2293 [Prevotella nigrescens ATCC 33563]|nr:hypothetical protein HMPREF9419_2293 [Prevotella nigrescens ATCC 33563]